MYRQQAERECAGSDASSDSECRNSDYAALLADSEADDSVAALFPAPKLEEYAEELDTVYRSLGAMTMTAEDPQQLLRNPLSGFEDSEALLQRVQVAAVEIASMRCPISSYRPAATHAFSASSKPAALVQEVLEGLRAAGVDCGAFDNVSSAIPCKVVSNSWCFRFNVFILELLPACKQARHASFIVEVQRLSSSGSVAEWGQVVDRVMDNLEETLFAGFYDYPRRLAAPERPAGGPPALTRQSSGSQQQRLMDADSDDEGDDDDDDALMATVDESALIAEYANMTRLLCSGSCWEQRLELAQLMASISAEARVAAALRRAGAVQLVLGSLAREAQEDKYSDLVLALCSVVSNLSKGMEVDQVPDCASIEAAAASVIGVLETATPTNFLQAELMREAARALAVFAPGLRSGVLCESARRVAQTCSEVEDERLSRNGGEVLRALPLCA